jgi:hypothetical protein
MKFDFTDKASYLAWRQEWRENYADLTKLIRAQKRGRKMYLRTYRTVEGQNGFRARELVSKMPNPEYGNYTQWKLGKLQAEAWSQMDILKEAKALSWTLKQESAKKQAVA